jgi:molybdate transport system ATP-binding protein
MAALDVAARGSVRHRLRQHLEQFGGSCVMVTHDPLDAAALADRLVILEGGQVVQRGTLDQVTAHPQTAYVAELVGLNLIEGVADGTDLVVSPGFIVETASPARGPRLAVIVPRDVALHLNRPEGSPRNAWPTRVAEVHLMGDRARVLLDGPVRLSAEITARSLAELRLTDGSPVWASVKATQIDSYPAIEG